MYQTTPLATLRLPTPNGTIPLTINRITGPDPATTGVASATALDRPETATITVVGEVGDYALDLGVRAERIAVAALPHPIESPADDDLIAELVIEYRDRLANLTMDLADLGLVTGEGVALALDIDDLAFLVHCLTLVQRRWQEAIDDAEAAAHQPRRSDPPRPGCMDIEPTPTGYRAAAGIFATELARIEQITQRLAQLLDYARVAADEDGEPR